MNRVRVGGLVLSLAALAGVGTTMITPTAATAATAAVEEDPRLKPPAGHRGFVTYKGVGAQVYKCTNRTWTLLQPDADLLDGHRKVGDHGRGPNWRHNDGSVVVGAAVPGAAVQRRGAIPEILVKTTSTRGRGTFSPVTFIQRLNTRGGLAPTGPCDNGRQTRVQYSADYKFWKAV
jgi:hypothetical protein